MELSRRCRATIPRPPRQAATPLARHAPPALQASNVVCVFEGMDPPKRRRDPPAHSGAGRAPHPASRGRADRRGTGPTYLWRLLAPCAAQRPDPFLTAAVWPGAGRADRELLQREGMDARLREINAFEAAAARNGTVVCKFGCRFPGGAVPALKDAREDALQALKIPPRTGQPASGAYQLAAPT